MSSFEKATEEENNMLSKNSVRKQTLNNEQVKLWTGCDEPGCTWFQGRWGDGNGYWADEDRKRQPPLPKEHRLHKTQYDIKANPEEGILYDNKGVKEDDGRGDVGRLERYRQTFTDHKTRYHNKNKASPPSP